MTAASTSQLDRRRPAAGAVVLQGDGGEVQAKVLDVGTGRPVVFLHGLAGLNLHWEDVVGRVKGRVRCIMLELPLLDLRGDDCSIDGVSRLATRFLEQYLPGGRPVLVGNSFGGHVALRIVLERPDLVGGLVLAGSSGLNERTMVREVLIRPTREWMRRKIAELFHDESTLREADVDRAFTELSDRKRARAMVRLSKTARRDHLGGRIGEIACPTLIIWGRNDVVTPPDAAEEFHRLIRDSRIVWIDRCGHAPMLEKPEEFSHALKGFADDLDRRGRR